MQKCTPNLKLWFQTRKRAGEGACTMNHNKGPYIVVLMDYTNFLYWAHTQWTIQSHSIGPYKLSLLTIQKLLYWPLQSCYIDHYKVLLLTIQTRSIDYYKLILLTITNLFYWSLQHFLIIITKFSNNHYKLFYWPLQSSSNHHYKVSSNHLYHRQVWQRSAHSSASAAPFEVKMVPACSANASLPIPGLFFTTALILIFGHTARNHCARGGPPKARYSGHQNSRLVRGAYKLRQTDALS